MIIKIKGIWHERTEDAPFIGALVSSIDCGYNCIHCFNQHIKDIPTKLYSETDIVNEIKSNIFNQGIILSGLEWTLQPDEMISLVNCAIDNNLLVMLYTGMEESIFCNLFPEVVKQSLYIKFGRYNENLKSNNYASFGVKLASTNQYIKRFGCDN